MKRGKTSLSLETRRKIDSDPELSAYLKAVEGALCRYRGLSYRDELTPLFNRRYRNRAFRTMFESAVSRHREFSIMMLDGDGFKEYNDTHGHDEGDNLIRELALLIQGTIRKGDRGVRNGGDEFCVGMPLTGFFDAYRMAERIRTGVEGMYERGRALSPVTVSIGIANYPALNVNSALDLRKKADSALYQAKERGGNLVVPMPEEIRMIMQSEDGGHAQQV